MTGMNAARHRVTNWTLHPNVRKPAEINHSTFDFPNWNYNDCQSLIQFLSFHSSFQETMDILLSMLVKHI